MHQVVNASVRLDILGAHVVNVSHLLLKQSKNAPYANHNRNIFSMNNEFLAIDCGLNTLQII